MLFCGADKVCGVLLLQQLLCGCFLVLDLVNGCDLKPFRIMLHVSIGVLRGVFVWLCRVCWLCLCFFCVLCNLFLHTPIMVDVFRVCIGSCVLLCRMCFSGWMVCC